MGGNIEQLRASLRATDPFCNDHDYICECRPVDVRLALAEVDRLRKLEGSDIPEDRCDRCGGRNLHSWYADSDVWNRVAGDYSILCPICFSELAEKAGVATTAWRLSIEGDDSEVSKLRTRLHARLEESAQLQAIVDKLPKTADGVPVVPGMTVFVRWSAGNIIEYKVFSTGAAIFLDGPDGEEQVMEAHQLYSTREAAEAAASAQPRN